MLSVRALARSAPRAALPRLTSSSNTILGRRAASQICASARTPSYRLQPSFASSNSSILSRLAPTQVARTFTSSAARRAGETDDELIAKVESELAYEDGVKDDLPMPTSIRDFLDN